MCGWIDPTGKASLIIQPSKGGPCSSITEKMQHVINMLFCLSALEKLELIAFPSISDCLAFEGYYLGRVGIKRACDNLMINVSTSS